MTGRAAVLSRIKTLPSIPASIGRIAELIKNDASTAADFERVLTPDPALTGNLLRVANSAYFSLSREITSVRQAVVLLGTRRLFEIAATAGFNRVLPKRLPGYDIEAVVFWTHCVAVAVISGNLAQALGLKAPDLLFTAGLLHDLGKLAMSTFLVDRPGGLKACLGRDDVDIVEAERAVIGIDHTEVGGLVAEQWKLPDAIRWAARWHHEPELVPDGVDRTAIDLVHLSDNLAHQLGLGADIGELARRVESRVVERLGVKTSKLEHTASESMDAIKEMSKIFTSGGAV